MEGNQYTAKEIAFKEKVSLKTVYRWCADGFLQCKRRPTKKGKGNIVVDENHYLEFKKIFDNLS